MVKRRIFFILVWSVAFFLLATLCSVFVTGALASLPLLAEGQKDSLMRVAATIGAFRGSPSVWVALGAFSLLFSVGGTLAQLLPGTDDASFERYNALRASLADDGSPRLCLNCGYLVIERFCGHCGQDRGAHLDVTMGEFVAHTIPDIINVDKKFFRSLWLLLTKPGTLTVEYFRGRHASYSPPMQMYFVVATVFFFVSAAIEFDVESLVRQSPTLIDKVKTTAERERVTPAVIIERVENRLENYIPFYTFIMVVAFAAILKILFLSERYISHFIFSLHFITAFLIFWIVPLIASLLIPAASKYDFLIIALPTMFYLARALQTVHPQKTRWLLIPAIVGFSVLVFLYMVASLSLSIFAL